MRLFKFRTLFALVVSLALCGFGVYLGQQLPTILELPALAGLKDVISAIPAYTAKFTLALGTISFLLGVWVGPRCGDLVLRAGHTLEEMSAADKIAVAFGIILGVGVTLLISQLLFALKFPAPLLAGIISLFGVVFIYLGIVAMISMKTEIGTMITRNGSSVQGDHDARPTANCKILDTNVIIDGRIATVVETGFLEGTLYVPGFVLEELQHIADSGDSLKRARGRRGLDILNEMQQKHADRLLVRVWDKALEASANRDEVDTRLVKLAKALDGLIVTNDYNLNKVAGLQGVTVLNVNDLALSLKPVVLPGEPMSVTIVKEGKEQTQGVAYLDDGTMIVVEDGRRHIGETQNVVVTSVLQTVAGKMIFARIRTDEDGDDQAYRADGTNGHAGTTGFTRRTGGGPRRQQSRP